MKDDENERQVENSLLKGNDDMKRQAESQRRQRRLYAI
jgi:hypothetical protein